MLNQYIIPLLIILMVMFYVWQPLDARQYLLTSIVGVLCVLVAIGWIKIDMPPWAMVAFLTWIIMTTAWSTIPKQSWLDVMMWFSLILIYAISKHVEPYVIMAAILVPGIYLSLIVYVQRLTKYEQVSKIKGIRYLFGNKQNHMVRGSIFGNANHFGAFAMLAVFAGVWCGLNIHPLLFIACPFIYGAMLISWQCKAALCITTIGLCYIGFHVCTIESFVGVLLGSIASIFIFVSAKIFQNRARVKSHNQSSFKDRIGYIITTWNCIKKRPFHGWGLRTFRREQFFATARMLKKNAKAFDKIPRPSSHRAHCDLLEIWQESGLIGLGLFVWMFKDIQFLTGDPVVVVAIGSFFLLSLVFFPFKEVYLTVPFFCLVGIASPTDLIGSNPSSPDIILAILAASFLSYEFGIKKVISTYWWFKLGKIERDHFASGDKTLSQPRNELYFKSLKKAYQLDPFNNHILLFMWKKAKDSDPEFALDCAMRLNEHYDGTVPAHFLKMIRPAFLKSNNIKKNKKGKKKNG